MKEILKLNYRAYDAIRAEARPRAQVWRLILGLALCFVVLFMGTNAIWSALEAILSPDAFDILVRDQDGFVLTSSLLILLYTFVLFWIGPCLAVWTTHQRSMFVIFGSVPLALKQFRASAIALLTLAALLIVLPPYGFDPPLQSGLPFGHWLAMLIPALIGICIQAGGEEVLFRGYLQGQLAARFKAPWIWIGIPSVLFGLAHYAPDTYGANTWLVVTWAALFGALASDLTARAGTLGPAIAFHVVTNAIAILLVAPQGDLSGLALYQFPFSADDEAAIRAMLPVDFLAMLTSWLAVRLVLRR